jgi:hypothetical protein
VLQALVVRRRSCTTFARRHPVLRVSLRHCALAAFIAMLALFDFSKFLKRDEFDPAVS